MPTLRKFKKAKKSFYLKARHPLIAEDEVVANTFNIDETNRIVVITGPNAGGKTVALKTIGLLIMMNQSGLLLPTDGEARLGYFKSIFADIGDQQSLSDNLSTFFCSYCQYQRYHESCQKK